MNEEFSLWVECLIDEGYDLSGYSWDEMYDIYENLIYEGVVGRGDKLRPASVRTAGGSMTAAQRAKRAKEQKEQAAIEDLIRTIKAEEEAEKKRKESGESGRRSPMGSTPPPERPSPPSRGAVTTLLKPGEKGTREHHRAHEVLKKAQQDEAYELVLDYLIDEGYVNDYQSADVLIENMSEEWLMNILEAEMWIQKAIKKPGALRKSLKVKAGKDIPYRKLKSASQKGGKMGRRARLAMTLRKFH